MRYKTKYKYLLTTLYIISALTFIFTVHRIPLVKRLHWKIFGVLLRIQHMLTPLPAGINDIVLVTIDDETVRNMPHRWPYPRSDFAVVIENLKKAHPKVIAFDFVFLGESTQAEDNMLKEAFKYKDGKVILAATINEKGGIDLSTMPGLSNEIATGIVTKLKDPDEVIRRALTYLVSEQKENKGFLAWEMQILKATNDIDFSTFEIKNSSVSFRNKNNEEWVIPVGENTKSYLVNFRANTRDFNTISFYQVLQGDFPPAAVKNKIIMVGFTSYLFQDTHHTSIGWIPGLTLNANAFLTLYTRSFLKDIPRNTELITLIIGIITACIFAYLFKPNKALLMIAIGVFLFFLLSYILLLKGYTWDYFSFPLLVILYPFMIKKLFGILWHFKYIIFVNNDVEIRGLFYTSLPKLKYKITTLTSNKEVLEVLKKQRPDYIILDPADAGMPADNATEQIKSIAPEVKIIIPHPKGNAQQFVHNIVLAVKYGQHTHIKESCIKDNIPVSDADSSKQTYSDPRRILIIDDDKECIALIKTFLSRRGYNAEAALSGEEAISKIQEYHPHIVILDIMMQGIDGLVVLKTIKGIDKSIVVIMTSGVGNEQIINESFKLGADYYLIKPFNLSELERIIGKKASGIKL